MQLCHCCVAEVTGKPIRASQLLGDFPGNRDFPGKSLRLNGKYDFPGK